VARSRNALLASTDFILNRAHAVVRPAIQDFRWDRSEFVVAAKPVGSGDFSRLADGGLVNLVELEGLPRAEFLSQLGE